MSERISKQNRAAAAFFAAVFMNGFEAAGYQASLLTIGNAFGLNFASMGFFASVQLIAGLIAPLVFGPLADRSGKRRFFLAFLAAEIVGSIFLILPGNEAAFLAGIFLIGISTSGLQYIAIAALSDIYPATGKKKTGILTGFYSMGAVLAPLVCGFYLNRGYSWKILFILLGLSALGNLLFTSAAVGFEPQESGNQAAGSKAEDSGNWILSGILFLSFIMFLYVGFENGFAFFIGTYIRQDLGGSKDYFALSLFWLAMIPSRLLCGYFAKYSRRILLAACAGAGLFAALTGLASGEIPAIILCFPLGFFSGAVYPSVLNRLMEFAGGRSATAAGILTAATGLGGAAITQLMGISSGIIGVRTGIFCLAGLMAVDAAAAAWLLKKKKIQF
jgi:MFS transporter, FHS family, glucose/mannose:H+ symporter